MSADELDPAAELLERLLTDSAYRARFRSDPVAACREHGLDDLAAELAGSGRSAMHTLEMRESKSSLAGVMLAAAAEGVGVYALVHHVGPFLDGHAAKVVHRALTLPKLDAVQGKLAHGESANAAVGSLPAAGGAGPGAEPAAQAAPSAAVSPGAAATPEAAAPADAAAAPAAPAPADAAAAPGAAAPPDAAAPADAAAAPGAPAPADAAGAAPPAGHSAPWPSDDAGVARAGAPPMDAPANAAGHSAGAGAAAAAADAAPPAGAAGGDVQALLENPKLTLPPTARQDLESGTVDPRIVAMLGKLLGDHQIGVSNHVGGSGLDITSVDGRPVNPANDAAREVAGELAALPAAIRPTQVGTPFNIGGGGFFTDADHQDHIHVGFDTPAPAAANAPAAHSAAAAADALAAPEAAAPKAEAALHAAEKQLGTPYLWGGAGPDRFDCSGLMQWAYKQVGVDLPRVAEDQAHVGVPVPRDQLRPGDLIPFADPSGYVHHIGMYVGDGKFIHAPHTGDVVKISSLNEPYFAQQYAGARRVVSGGVADAVRAVAASAPAPPAGAEQAAAPAADQVAGAPARSDTAAFEAIAKQEASWHRQTAQFLQAVKERPDWATPRAEPGASAVPDAPAAPGASDAPGASAPVDLGDAPSDYPGESAPREEIARWMAAAAKRAGLPAELPVMASLVESGMHNLSGGDRDSVGFFQMRVGIWNQGPYAGYPDNPQLQVKWFIDQALAVKHQRIAAGRGAELTDPQRYGEFIADIERPAEQFRGRYQLQLGEAQRLLGGGA